MDPMRSVGPILGVKESGADGQRCLTQCMTLYMAAFDQVSKSYVARVTRERGAAGGPPGLL